MSFKEVLTKDLRDPTNYHKTPKRNPMQTITIKTIIMNNLESQYQSGIDKLSRLKKNLDETINYEEAPKSRLSILKKK
jgi:hypothetical protein